MKRFSLLGLVITAAMAAAPVRAFAESPTVDKTLGIRSETKPVKGNNVVVFVQEHGKTLIVQVVVSIDAIRYSDIAVTGFGLDGKELEIRQLFPQKVSYGKMNPGSPVGAYKITLKDGERLAKVKVARQDESQIFDLLVKE